MKKILGGIAVTVAVVLVTPMAAIADSTPTSSGSTYRSTVTARWTGAVDVSSRRVVNASYWTRYAENYSVSTGWSGSLLGCLLGWTSTRSQAATRESLNYVRSLAGLAPVNFSSTMNRRALSAALMMSANNTLSHYPTSSWRCYSSTGDATAAKSNLALAYPRISSGQVVDLYMDDRGSSNKAVGHRRWVLNPFTTAMGNGTTHNANALMVVGPTSSSRPNPRWVSWPSKGYFPKPLEPAGRWSLSSGFKNTNFRDARVRVYKNGVRIAVRKYAVHNGYAMPTLVWQMPTDRNRVGTFKVVVSNVKRSGYAPTSYTYRVKVFNPTR